MELLTYKGVWHYALSLIHCLSYSMNLQIVIILLLLLLLLRNRERYFTKERKDNLEHRVGGTPVLEETNRVK